MRASLVYGRACAFVGLIFSTKKLGKAAFFENTASSRENKAGYIYIGKAALKKNIFFFIPISGGRDFVYFSIFRRALALLKNLQALI
jgi:hypothetical protein